MIYGILFCYRELECVPDVFSLIEWSNWLTPSNYMRRFDTIFYFCCMDTKPDTTHDDLEVSRVEVSECVQTTVKPAIVGTLRTPL